MNQALSWILLHATYGLTRSGLNSFRPIQLICNLSGLFRFHFHAECNRTPHRVQSEGLVNPYLTLCQPPCLGARATQLNLALFCFRACNPHIRDTPLDRGSQLSMKPNRASLRLVLALGACAAFARLRADP